MQQMKRMRTIPKQIRVMLWTIVWISCLFAIAETVFSTGFPYNISRLEQYTLRTPGDPFIHNAFEIQRIIQKDKSDSVPVFVYLGGSAARGSTYSDSTVEKQVQNLTGTRIKFSNLSSNHRHFIDDLNMVEEMEGSNDVVVITIEALRFGKSGKVIESNIGRMPYPPYRLDSLRLLIEHGVAVYPNNMSYLLRSIKHLGESSKKSILYTLKDKRSEGYNIRRYDFAHREDRKRDLGLTKKEKAKRLQNILGGKKLKLYRQNWEFNLATLKKVIERSRSYGNEVILVDLPQNPLLSDSYQDFYEHYDPMVQELVNETGIIHFDLRFVRKWVPQDFKDAHHLTRQGSLKYTEAFSQALADYISETRGHKGSSL